MALSRDKLILIGVVVLAGLGTAVYYQSKKDAALGVATTQSTDMPTVSGTDDVDKISIVNADKGEVVLEKKGDKWALTKPVEAPANQANVKSLIDNMKELKAKEVVTKTADDDMKKEYQLDAAHAVHVMAWKGTDKKLDESFGKSGGRGEMMMVEGKPAVYAATGYTSYLYSREVKAWRDTEIFKFDDANATQMTIDNKNGAFSFTKGDKWAGTFKGKPIDRLDEDKVKAALGAFKTLIAEDFGDAKPAAETGLDKPEAKFTVTLKDNAGKYVLNLGKVSSGSSHYAQKEGDSTVFVVGSLTSEYAEGDLAKFQRSLDAGVKDATATAPPKMPGGMPGMPGMPPGHPKLP